MGNSKKLIFDKGKNDVIFLGDFVCWLRENNQIEYSLNGELFEGRGIGEFVQCESKAAQEPMEYHYTIDTELKTKYSEYVDLHETIPL